MLTGPAACQSTLRRAPTDQVSPPFGLTNWTDESVYLRSELVLSKWETGRYGGVHSSRVVAGKDGRGRESTLYRRSLASTRLRTTACAAASRAMGTRNGDAET